MRIISADFNAGTESGSICLGSRGSQESLRDQGARLGDWIWLSDGELVVGAQLAVDERYGIVGLTRWDTLAHLDDDDSNDIPGLWNEFLALSRKPRRDADQEARAFEILTALEVNSPREFKEALPPGYLALRRAAALHFLGEAGLASIELEDALRERAVEPEPGVEVGLAPAVSP
jgi:hypothetical protein